MDEFNFDFVIIGAGPAGLAAAQYASRGGLSAAVLESAAIGGQVMQIMDLENYPGIFPQVNGIEFINNMKNQAEAFGAKFFSVNVSSIDKQGDFFIVKTKDTVFKSYALLIATGAIHRNLEVKGEKEFSGRGVSYCAVCDGPFFKNKNIYVVGGGDSACSEAIYLSSLSPNVLGLHYAPFAYILIGGIFQNMDANLEEAATILDTPKWRIMTRVTLPMVKPAILSTILLVFGSAMGSYPVPHYLGLTTLSTKYVSMNSKYTGEASILAIIMMVFGVAIMLLNQLSLTSRKNYTTVTGKSGQSSKFNLGKVGKYAIALILVVLTFFTSIFPIVSFAFETFLPNPGDYSFLYTGNIANLTTKWWLTSENITENGMYGQQGILYNPTIWRAYGGTIWVSICCALLAGTIGTLCGYAVSKQRRSKWANYVNSVAFLPYLMPSLAVGAAFFILFSTEKLNLFNSYTLLIVVGTIKYIPFASRSSLNSMLQLSGEIEEAAIIQDIPWIKRMTRIIIPIQKSSIISGYLLPFMTCLRELSLFMLLCGQGLVLATTLDYFDEMGLYAFSSGINLILIITILVSQAIVNKVTGASLDKGIGG